MPTENPTLNSVRVQRAQRINNIEESRMGTRLNLLEKERWHQMRVYNQDIRMVSITLEYIQSSSGYSPEALSPDYVESQVKKEPEPCFMYGQRLRRWKKSRRAQSAPSIGRRKEEEANKDDTLDLSLAESKKPGWGSAYFPMEKISEKGGNSMPKERPSTTAAAGRSAPLDECPQPAHEAFVADRSNRPTSKQNTPLEEMHETLKRYKAQLEVIKSQRQRQAHGRTAAITQAVNKVRVLATSAKRIRNLTPMQALIRAPSKTPRQKEAWEQKVTLNTDRNQKLEARLNNFMESSTRKEVV